MMVTAPSDTRYYLPATIVDRDADDHVYHLNLPGIAEVCTQHGVINHDFVYIVVPIPHTTHYCKIK